MRSIRPYPGSRIDEEQFFILQLNGPATLASVQANVWCAVDGLGERVPVKLVDGTDRAQLLKSQGLEKAAAADPLSVVTLACNRRLTAATNVQIVYGKGVATPQAIANTIEKRFNFQVREPFTASFNCERENAQSACLPIRPLSLNFNAPVPRKLAQGIRLIPASGKDVIKPVFDSEDAASKDGDSIVNGVRFPNVLPELTQFTLELPRDFKDASARPLRNADSFPLKVSTGPMPPLAKFAAAPFGIVERLAEPDGLALLPVTLRNVEAALQIKGLNAGTAQQSLAPSGTPGKVSDLKLTIDTEIIAWFAKVQYYDNYSVSRKVATADVKGPLPKVLEVRKDGREGEDVQSRMLSLLQGQPGVKTLDLPKPASGDPRPFEEIGRAHV